MTSKIGLEDFKEYLERYCKDKGIDEETALKHAIVREVADYYGLLLKDTSKD